MDFYQFGLKYLFIFLIGFFILLLLKRPFDQHRHNRKKSLQIFNKIRSFHGETQNAQMFSYLRKIDPVLFEKLILDCFEQRGFKIKRNSWYSVDKGIYGKMVDQNGNLILVQSKRYIGHINVQHVRDFALIVSKDRNAKKGYFIHTGKTGKDVYSVLKNHKNIKLVSGNNLLELLQFHS